MMTRVLDKDFDGIEVQDLGYIARVLDVTAAANIFSCLPYSGGYLNQPVTLMRDVQAMHSILAKRRRDAVEEAQIARVAMSNSITPDAPPPPMRPANVYSPENGRD